MYPYTQIRFRTKHGDNIDVIKQTDSIYEVTLEGKRHMFSTLAQAHNVAWQAFINEENKDNWLAGKEACTTADPECESCQ